MQGCRELGGWGALAPPVFGRTVNPISTRGADYAHCEVYRVPSRIFRPSDGPDVYSILEFKTNFEMDYPNKSVHITEFCNHYHIHHKIYLL